eukprot:scaffold148729_cov15-Tisochrysis_lutea.AAC.1
MPPWPLGPLQSPNPGHSSWSCLQSSSNKARLRHDSSSSSSSMIRLQHNSGHSNRKTHPNSCSNSSNKARLQHNSDHGNRKPHPNSSSSSSRSLLLQSHRHPRCSSTSSSTSSSRCLLSPPQVWSSSYGSTRDLGKQHGRAWLTHHRLRCPRPPPPCPCPHHL